jgi:uncharacterized protein YndB with AHSA1/START domain
MQSHYEFVSHWDVPAPRSLVWEVLMDLPAYPQWWPSIERVDTWTDGAGTLHARTRVRSRFRYELGWEGVYDEISPPSRSSYRVELGDLLGRGDMTLAESPGGTSVTYRWDVQTTRRWMKLLAPVLRPVFVWGHHRVMDEGLRGLRSEVARRSALV